MPIENPQLSSFFEEYAVYLDQPESDPEAIESLRKIVANPHTIAEDTEDDEDPDVQKKLEIHALACRIFFSLTTESNN